VTREQRLLSDALNELEKGSYPANRQEAEKDYPANRQEAEKVLTAINNIRQLFLASSLCQTLAFLEKKCGGEGANPNAEEKAMRKVRTLVKRLLGVTANDLAANTALLPVEAYITRCRIMRQALIHMVRAAEIKVHSYPPPQETRGPQ
jgi:hypothetical protein